LYLDYPYRTRVGFTMRTRSTFSNASTLHRVGVGELQMLPGDGNRLSVRWCMKDTHAHRATVLEILPSTAKGAGYYHEEWRKQGDDSFLAGLRDNHGVQCCCKTVTAIRRLLLSML